MILRDIDFGPVLDATGVRGFFGEGYRHHRILGPLGPDFDGSTFVSKTTTLKPRKGNLELDENYGPKKFFPDCIRIYPAKGVVLNAVGLSGPGAQALFERGEWQKREKPFFISIMSVAKTRVDRWEDMLGFVNIFSVYLREVRAPVGLQVNFSCPNVGLTHSYDEDFVHEVLDVLQLLEILNVPLMPKFNVLLPVRAAKKISEHRACDALCISNTLPWGALPSAIDWKELFGSDESPLAKYGGGGLSGKPLLPLIGKWGRDARLEGVKKPIHYCGGIMSRQDVRTLAAMLGKFLYPNDSIAVGGAASILRPWKVRGIIEEGHKLFAERRQ
ncbi:hypothetical protein KJ885_03055 [Patescibacteria group bacterium]|nr:hypothetical protein [Patescibacteria group bacterium]